jgi:predicted alpha/beta superfamily hydrolase
MIRFYCLFLIFSIPFFTFSQSIPIVPSGSIEHIEAFESKYIDPRTIDIWLPEGYTTSKKYAVLYMHDGQMLFDSSMTWNKQSWDVDNVITKLLNDKKIKNTIVVGIWNNGKSRHAEYFPQQPFESLSISEKDSLNKQLRDAGRTEDVFAPISDAYLKCIVEEIIPFISENYSVKKGRKNTLISGSSMGGLISLYALCEYPDVFGGAACISTHWPGAFTLENNPFPAAMINYLSVSLPNSRNHRIYFDCGDQTLDALYPDIQRQVDLLLDSKGFNDKNALTCYFPGADHSEVSWSKRLDIPLLFLLGKE